MKTIFQPPPSDEAASAKKRMRSRILDEVVAPSRRRPAQASCLLGEVGKVLLEVAEALDPLHGELVRAHPGLRCVLGRTPRRGCSTLSSSSMPSLVSGGWPPSTSGRGLRSPP